jgi:hypothetical protein
MLSDYGVTKGEVCGRKRLCCNVLWQNVTGGIEENHKIAQNDLCPDRYSIWVPAESKSGTSTLHSYCSTCVYIENRNI